MRLDKLLSKKRMPIKDQIVVIGSSTGGPIAVEKLLEIIPDDFELPVVIAQHLPKRFTKTFAERLNKAVEIPVSEADDGQEIETGQVYICPGDSQSFIKRNSMGIAYIEVVPDEKSTLTPSVDNLFTSASEIYKDGVIAVILTGMGKDGTAGCKVVRDHGGTVIVQDRDTSAVYGMGQAVVNEGLADRVVPLDQIINVIRLYIK